MKRFWTICAAAFLFAAPFFSAADELPREDALILYLAFEEGRGETAADSSPNKFEATFNGAFKWANGRIGGGVELESGIAVVPDDDRLDVEQLTAMAWVNPSEIFEGGTCHTWGNMIYQKSGASDDSVEFVLLGGSGACLYLNTGPGGADRMGPFNGADVDTKLTLPNLGINENQWTHMAATFDGETMAIYVNGAEAGSMAVRAGNPSIIFNDNDSSIGGRTHNNSYFKGLLDEFALFNRALDETELKQWMDMSFSVNPLHRAPITWGMLKTPSGS